MAAIQPLQVNLNHSLYQGIGTFYLLSFGGLESTWGLRTPCLLVKLMDPGLAGQFKTPAFMNLFPRGEDSSIFRAVPQLEICLSEILGCSKLSWFQPYVLWSGFSTEFITIDSGPKCNHRFSHHWIRLIAFSLHVSDQEWLLYMMYRTNGRVSGVYVSLSPYRLYSALWLVSDVW